MRRLFHVVQQCLVNLLLWQVFVIYENDGRPFTRSTSSGGELLLQMLLLSWRKYHGHAFGCTKFLSFMRNLANMSDGILQVDIYIAEGQYPE